MSVAAAEPSSPPATATKAPPSSPFAHLPETLLTTSRPLGQSELGHAMTRHVQGYSDSYTIVTLDSTGTDPITDEELVLACAAVRLRHPILVTTVSFTNQRPEFICTTPFTQAHALKEARALIEFHTFQDREKEASALRDRWISSDPQHALDVRVAGCTIWWSKGVDAAAGQYVFGVQTTHFVTDGRSRMNVMRHFLELLATPGKAQEELTAFYARKLEALRTPESLETLIPDLSLLSAEDLEKGKRAYEEFRKLSSEAMTGLRPNGTLEVDKAKPRLVLHVWSQSDSAQILRSCKAHSVTITHLGNAAMALAAVPLVADQTGSDHHHYFTISQAMDLSSRFQPTVAATDLDTATRVATFPVFLHASHVALTGSEWPATVWAMAKQCKEATAAYVTSPHFWQFVLQTRKFAIEDYHGRIAGKSFLPVMSSMGECTKILPTHYPVSSSKPAGHVNGTNGAEAAQRREITVADMLVGTKADIIADTLLLWTYNGKLHAQLMHNAARCSPAVMDAHFDRVVEIITQLGAEGAHA